MGEPDGTKALQEYLRENHGEFDDGASLLLWKCVVLLEGCQLQTTGRGGKGAVAYSYMVSREAGRGGRHYEGASLPGYGNELWITTGGVRKEKSISRSSLDMGFRKYLEAGGDVSGPKKLGVFGASYMLPLFWEIYRGEGADSLTECAAPDSSPRRRDRPPESKHC